MLMILGKYDIVKWSMPFLATPFTKSTKEAAS